jgi:hypothetical protein
VLSTIEPPEPPVLVVVATPFFAPTRTVDERFRLVIVAPKSTVKVSPGVTATLFEYAVAPPPPPPSPA